MQYKLEYANIGGWVGVGVGCVYIHTHTSRAQNMHEHTHAHTTHNHNHTHHARIRHAQTHVSRQIVYVSKSLREESDCQTD